MPHPPLKPRPTITFAPASHRKGESCRSRLILGRQLPQEDAADARVKVHRPADGERVPDEWSLLKPSGVVGDERECTETDLVAVDQNST